MPAFQGLGTPYLDVNARALIGGLSRGTGRAQIARAVLEGVAYRCAEVIEALLDDSQVARPDRLRVDGGMAANDVFLQCQADTLGSPVERPEIVQATALGVAYLAGMGVGVWDGVEQRPARLAVGRRVHPAPQRRPARGPLCDLAARDCGSPARLLAVKRDAPAHVIGARRGRAPGASRRRDAADR